MSWLSKDWPYRAPITTFTAASIAGPYNFNQGVGALSFDLFWDNVMLGGEDLRITLFDGITTVAGFMLSNWNPVQRAGVMSVDTGDATGITAAQSKVLWIYWGNPNAGAAFSPVNPQNPYSLVDIALDKPNYYTVRCRQEQIGATRPSQAFAAMSSDRLYLYWDISEVLTQRYSPDRRSSRYWQVQSYRVQVMSQSTVITGKTLGPTFDRYVEHNGRTYIRIGLYQLVANTDYTIELELLLRPVSGSTDMIQQKYRALLIIRNPDDT